MDGNTDDKTTVPVASCNASSGQARDAAMSKLILIVLVVLFAWWILRSYLRSVTRKEPPKAPEDMVQCAHCGVHLPRSESQSGNGEFFCSEEHLRLRR